MMLATAVQYRLRGRSCQPSNKGKVMILDYSQPRRGPTLACCIRTLWSSDARVEFARCASWAHAIVVLTSVATVAAMLTASNTWLREAVVRGLAPNATFASLIFDELLTGGRSTGRFALQLIPVYFAALAGTVYIIALL